MSGVVINSYIVDPFPIPKDGLVSMLDGSVAESFYSDDAKTTNATQGQDVAVWEDQSGNGNDWYQTNIVNRPIAHPDNNRLYSDGLGLAGGSTHLMGPNMSAQTAGSCFARIDVTGGISGAIWGTTDWDSADSLGHWDFSGTHYICFGSSGRAGIAGISTALLTYEENVTSAALVTAYIDGSSIYSGTLGTTGFRTVPYLGCGVRSGTFQYSIGAYYYKFCCYDRVVTSDERTQINTWLES